MFFFFYTAKPCVKWFYSFIAVNASDIAVWKKDFMWKWYPLRVFVCVDGVVWGGVLLDWLPGNTWEQSHRESWWNMWEDGGHDHSLVGESAGGYQWCITQLKHVAASHTLTGRPRPSPFGFYHFKSLFLLSSLLLNVDWDVNNHRDRKCYCSS